MSQVDARVSTYHDDVPSEARPKQPLDWEAYESSEAILAKRIRNTQATLQSLLGGKLEEQPRVALVFSGGGWRALTSGVAFLDALASPLDEVVAEKQREWKERKRRLRVEKALRRHGDNDNMHKKKKNKATASSPAGFVPPKGFKLLDTVTHAVGLSGGSWALAVSIANTDKEKNPYHTAPPTAAATTTATAPSSNNNPWLYGPAHSFNPQQNTYDGLRDMLSLDNVNRALQRGGASRFLAKAMPFETSMIEAVTSSNGSVSGTTKAEQWGKFVGNNLLSFLNTAEGCNGMPTTDAAESSLKKKLSSMQSVIREGDMPMIICTAIANRNEPNVNVVEDRPEVQKNKNQANYYHRRFDWVEVSPFFVRNPTTHHFSPDVDNCGVYFIKGKAHEDEPDARRHDMRLHQVMGMCGSAFALDREVVKSNVDLEPAKEIAKKGIAAVSGFFNTIQTQVNTAVDAARKDGARHEGATSNGNTNTTPSSSPWGFLSPSSPSPSQQPPPAPSPPQQPTPADGAAAAGNGGGDDADQLIASPLAAGTLTAISYGTHPKAAINTCRDAGLDFNIPFPLVLEGSSGRRFDIVIAMDAGMGSVGAKELAEAVRLGYVELVGELDLSGYRPPCTFSASSSPSHEGHPNQLAGGDDDSSSSSSDDEYEAEASLPTAVEVKELPKAYYSQGRVVKVDATTAPTPTPTAASSSAQQQHQQQANPLAAASPSAPTSPPVPAAAPPAAVNIPHLAFEPSQRVRVYLTASGTIIIYFIGLTTRSTLNIVVDGPTLEKDLATVREAAKEVQWLAYKCLCYFAQTRHFKAAATTAAHPSGVREEEERKKAAAAAPTVATASQVSVTQQQQQPTSAAAAGGSVPAENIPALYSPANGAGHNNHSDGTNATATVTPTPASTMQPRSVLPPPQLQTQQQQPPPAAANAPVAVAPVKAVPPPREYSKASSSGGMCC